MVNGPAMGSVGLTGLLCDPEPCPFHGVCLGPGRSYSPRWRASCWEAQNFEEGSSEVPGQSPETKRELSALVKLWERWYDFVRGNLSSPSLEREGPSHRVVLTYKDSFSSNRSSTSLILTTVQNIKLHWYINRWVFNCFGARMYGYGTEEWAISGYSGVRRLFEGQGRKEGHFSACFGSQESTLVRVLAPRRAL